MNTPGVWFDTELVEPAVGVCPAGVDAWGVAAVPVPAESDRAVARVASPLEAAGPAEVERVKTPADGPATVCGLAAGVVLATAGVAEDELETAAPDELAAVGVLASAGVADWPLLGWRRCLNT